MLNHLHQEIAKLRVELDEAKATIRELTKSSDDLQGVASLTRLEAVLVDALARRCRATKEQLYDAMYSLRHEDEQPVLKVVDVFVCKVRKKLAPHGISIGTIWGVGFEMSRNDVAKLRALAEVSL